MTRLPRALRYDTVTDDGLLTVDGDAILGYRVSGYLRHLPRLAVNLYTLYHLRRRARFPAAPTGGPPGAADYLARYHNAPRAVYADEVILTLRMAQANQTAAANHRDPALDRLTGPELLAFLRRATTFGDDAPVFDGASNLSEALIPWDIHARLGPIEFGAAYPRRVAMLVATQPPPTTAPAFLRHLLSLSTPLLVTTHFEPEPITVTATATRAALRRQRIGGDPALATAEAADLTREIFSTNTPAGRYSMTVSVPFASDDDLHQLSIVRTTFEASGWLCREPGVDSTAAYLSTYHCPVFASHRPRMTTANFLDTLTLPRRLTTDRPIAYLTGPAEDVQPFSPYVADVGHTAIVGPTGTGKSVLMGHLVVCALASGIAVTLFDQHRGFTRLARHLGGATRTCAVEAPLCNPFRRPLTPALLRWWDLFLETTVPAAAKAYRTEAIRSLYEMPPAERHLGGLIALFGDTGHDISELLDWFDGRRAQVFHPDNEPLSDSQVEHYDLTAVYDEPILLSYLTTRVMEQLAPTRPRILVFDEAWAAFDNPHLRRFLDDGIRTARKLGGAFVFASQRPADFAGWHENLATTIFLPNPTLTREQATAIAAVDDALVTAVREAIPRRHYVVAQGTAWTTVTLDLSGLPALLHLLQPDLGGRDVQHAS